MRRFRFLEGERALSRTPPETSNRFPKPKVAVSKPVVRFPTFPRQAAFPLLMSGSGGMAEDLRARRLAPLRAFAAKWRGHRAGP
jgi:hypothetical protein